MAKTITIHLSITTPQHNNTEQQQVAPVPNLGHCSAMNSVQKRHNLVLYGINKPCTEQSLYNRIHQMHHHN